MLSRKGCRVSTQTVNIKHGYKWGRQRLLVYEDKAPVSKNCKITCQHAKWWIFLEISIALHFPTFLDKYKSNQSHIATALTLVSMFATWNCPYWFSFGNIAHIWAQDMVRTYWQLTVFFVNYSWACINGHRKCFFFGWCLFSCIHDL